MLLDSIRVNDSAAAFADAVAARPASDPRAGSANVSPPTVPAARPVSISPPPERRDEINIKWETDDGVIVTFTDKESGEIVRQIPSEQVLSVVRFIREMLAQQSSEGESQPSF